MAVFVLGENRAFQTRAAGIAYLLSRGGVSMFLLRGCFTRLARYAVLIVVGRLMGRIGRGRRGGGRGRYDD